MKRRRTRQLNGSRVYRQKVSSLFEGAPGLLTVVSLFLMSQCASLLYVRKRDRPLSRERRKETCVLRTMWSRTRNGGKLKREVESAWFFPKVSGLSLFPSSSCLHQPVRIQSISFALQPFPSSSPARTPHGFRGSQSSRET